MKQISGEGTPNFLIIGAGKSGSTSLYKLLSQHPEIFMSNPKEINFFSYDKNFKRGWNWYKSFFIDSVSSLAVGEASGTYTNRTAFPKTAKRISKSIPEAKLIYIVRHPLDRIVSKWRMMAYSNPFAPGFNKAISMKSLQPDFTDRSKYWFQISAYRDYFPDSRILVLFFEDFISSPVREIKKCFKFLDVDEEVELTHVDKPHLSANNTRSYGYLLYFLRHLPISNLIVDIMPNRLRSLIRNSSLFTHEVVSIPEWDPYIRKWVTEQLAEDKRKFLKFYGKPDNFWIF